MKKILITVVAAAFVMGGMVATTLVAEAGVLTKCKACHKLKSDKKKVGPGLKSVFGRKNSQMVAKYGKSMKAHAGEWTWDEAHLREWVCNSKKAIKKFTGDNHAKTKMPPQKRCGAKADAVIAALKAL